MPLALPMQRLSYRCTDGAVKVGARVVVPIGKREVVAIVAAICDTPPENKLRDVVMVIDRIPLLCTEDIDFAQWVATYYMRRFGEIIRYGFTPLFSVEMNRLSSSLSEYKRAQKETKIEVKKEEINLEKQITLLHSPHRKINIAGLVANFAQSGKHVLVLAPTPNAASEIAGELSAHFTTALCTSTTPIKRRAYLHSLTATGLSPQVIVGTRSALWLCHKNLAGVIVTSEESFHYRSAREPYYSARECALVLASIHNVKCILTSAFPSVESYYNARWGHWGYIAPLAAEKPLNSIVLERGKEMVSAYARQKISETLESGRKVAVIQNRRGVASYIECESCGYIPQCPNCSVSLTLHRSVLGCHYCGYSEEIITNCKECGAPMVTRGRGTQQIEEQFNEYFPDANILRIDSDSLSDKNSDALSVIRGESSSWNILIGTTMLTGADIWDEVGVVAILNVDNMLSAANFRVEEDAYRTLGTLAERCRENDGELIIQSSRLDHRSVKAVIDGSFEEFYTTQITERQVPMFPPFSRMVRVEFRGGDLAQTMSLAQELEIRLRRIFGDRLSPIYQPIVERQRGEYILEMTLKVERAKSVAKAKEILLKGINEMLGRARSMKITITAEVDPT